METVTLVQSTIRGFVSGKAINCTVRRSPAGLTLPAGQYLLHPAANNPVYGLVMSIEPMRPGGQGPSQVKIESAVQRAPAMKYVTPSFKPRSPAHVKVAPASKVDAPASKVDAPASKVDAPASKVDAPASKAVDAPALRAGSIVLSGRAIAANGLVVTSGFAELVDAVQHAGDVVLIVK